MSARRIVVGLAAGCLAVAGCSGDADEPVRRTVVPRITDTDIASAYEVLREFDLRARTRRRFEATSLCMPTTSGQWPRSGRIVPRGTVVTFDADFCFHSSPVIRPGARGAVVPNLVGRRLSDAIAWAHHAGLYWSVEEAPALRPSDRPAVFDNYRVRRQSPPAGTRALPGVPSGSGVRITPVKLWAAYR